MPEGPELYITSRFINKVCRNAVFSGEIEKSAVSTRNPDVNWNEPRYRISAVSRGKELKLTLMSCLTTNDTKKTCEIMPRTMNLLFRFGMSGKFQFDPVEEKHKHAHLNFYTEDRSKVLSFVDYRRFGHWFVDEDWGSQRGPCVLQEYQQFRENVLGNLESSVFNKPICEVLLNQKYFNGIGNYLRAEILYRLKVAPFTRACDVIQPLCGAVKSENPDILALCNILPLEVTNLGDGGGYDPEAGGNKSSEFSSWLQCYYNPSMKNMADNNKRTIWFSGNPGPMAPSVHKTRKRVKKAHLQKKAIKVEDMQNDNIVKQETTDETKREDKNKSKTMTKRRKNHESSSDKSKGTYIETNSKQRKDANTESKYHIHTRSRTSMKT